MTAALLKLAGGQFSVYAQFGIWLSSSVQIIIIGWELLLGTLLLLGHLRTLAWFASLATFGVFAIVSGYLGIIGQANCGCFGSIEASPWVAFGIDAAAILAIFIFRPRSNFIEFRVEAVQALQWVGGLAVVFVALAIAGHFFYGSPAAALANLRGETLVLSETHLDFGNGAPGDIREATVTITNYSGEPRRIIGGTADCSCVTTRDLPITIPAGESHTLTIEYKYPNTDKPGLTNRKAILRTDDPKHPERMFTLSARVQ